MEIFLLIAMFIFMWLYYIVLGEKKNTFKNVWKKTLN